MAISVQLGSQIHNDDQEKKKWGEGVKYDRQAVAISFQKKEEDQQGEDFLVAQ